MFLQIQRQRETLVYLFPLYDSNFHYKFLIIFVRFQKRFPVDSLAEWNNGNPLGLRNVNAYVLVFDMGNLETFQVRVVVLRPCLANRLVKNENLRFCFFRIFFLTKFEKNRYICDFFLNTQTTEVSTELKMFVCLKIN